jgi:transposase
MRTGISITVSPADRRRLMAVVNDRNAPQKHVWRCRIVVLTADGVGTNEIMRRTAKSKTCVWRWQERYIDEGVEGLMRDKTRPSRKPPLPEKIKLAVLTKTANETPANATHWSRASMAVEMGISPSSVGRIWAAAGLKPHLVKRFKISNDSQFEEKVLPDDPRIFRGFAKPACACHHINSLSTASCSLDLRGSPTSKKLVLVSRQMADRPLSDGMRKRHRSLS